MDIILAMCGRFSLYASQTEIETELGVDLDQPPALRYNIAPGQLVLAVRLSEGTRECVPLRWGLAPPWARGPSAGGRLINARSETAAQKPAFREAFRQRRCLLPASGFFEWTRAAPKRPFYFLRRGEGLCILAGLWESWRGPDGSPSAGCVILTTTANATVAGVHERMPVIIEPEQCALWLGGDPDSAQALLAPARDDLLIRRAIGPWVNNPRREKDVCIAPIGEDGAGAPLPLPGF